MRSTILCTGALLPCASCTIPIIFDSTVSFPTLAALNVNAPFPLIVPANTSEPFCFPTGIGSPLSIDSSINEEPSITVPSAAILSPGCTTIMSPCLTSSIATARVLPSGCRTVTSAGRNPISFLMAEEVFPFALLSSVRPRRIKAIMTADASK